MNLKEKIKEMIKSALNELSIEFNLESIVVEVPKKESKEIFQLTLQCN